VVAGIDRIHRDRQALTCTVCRRREGACVQCAGAAAAAAAKEQGRRLTARSCAPIARPEPDEETLGSVLRLACAGQGDAMN